MFKGNFNYKVFDFHDMKGTRKLSNAVLSIVFYINLSALGPSQIRNRILEEYFLNYFSSSSKN